MKKLKKKHLDAAIDIGMVVALMCQESRLDNLYKTINEEWGIGGIVDTSYTMAWFATEAIDKYKDIDWEQVVMGDLKLPYLSNKYKGYGEHLCCWDEAMEDYAQWRIENFTQEEWGKINYGRVDNPMLKKS